MVKSTLPTRRQALFLLGGLGSVVVAGCGDRAAESPAPGAGGGSGTGAPRLKVTCTVGMVAYTVEQLAGSLAEVTALMGPGVDPHLYKASAGDVTRLSGADLILYSGLNLEGKMGDILNRLGRRKPVVAVSEELDESKLRRPAEFQGHPDPHVWFDVSLWSETVKPVEEALIRALPAAQSDIRTRAENYRQELAKLHEECRTQLATIPKERRVLITAHDAFGYFGRAYDVEVIGLQGISTASEAGLSSIQNLVTLISERRIPAVFVESSVPKRSIEAVVAGCAARNHQVAIGGTLYSDAMGEAGTPAGTYPGMVRHNVKTIVAALKP